MVPVNREPQSILKRWEKTNPTFVESTAQKGVCGRVLNEDVSGHVSEPDDEFVCIAMEESDHEQFCSESENSDEEEISINDKCDDSEFRFLNRLVPKRGRGLGSSVVFSSLYLKLKTPP